jgi:hypothetical protein
MGNTVLAHALFSCNKADIDIDQFFSSTGNAHAIRDINHTELTAEHLVEMPADHLKCLLEITCFDYWELLRIKMSYSKWMLEVPDLTNYSKFYFYNPDQDAENIKLWNSFYQSIRDPSWPDCNSPAEIKTLPKTIQAEINACYQLPDLSPPDTPIKLVEWLAKNYYNNFLRVKKHFVSVPSLDLGQYIQGNYQPLIDICKHQLNWQWDHTQSAKFHAKMLETNAGYLTWLEKIKSAVVLVINNEDVVDNFELWEQALVIAKVCHTLDQDPMTINWCTNSCNANEKSLYLDKFIRTNHGKTI